jgi:Undecaprenyl-phosphate glucose phosphotransferase
MIDTGSYAARGRRTAHMSNFQNDQTIASDFWKYRDRDGMALSDASAPAGDEQIDGRQSVPPSMLSDIQAAIMPLGITLAALLAKTMYFDIVLHSEEPMSSYLGSGVLAGLVFLLVSSQSSLHSATAIIAKRVQPRALVTTVTVTFLVVLCIFYLLKISDVFSRAWLAIWWAISIAVLMLFRFGILLWARLLQAERRLHQRIAVYGDAELGERVIERLLAKDRNVLVTGFFSDEASARVFGAPFLGGMPALIDCAQSGACDRVILALPKDADEKIREAIANLDILPIDVQLSPDAMTLPCQIQNSAASGGLVLLDVQRPPLDSRGILIKAAMDYVLGAILLVAFTPFMLAIAIAIKIDGGGPVFFVQSRHGYNHRVIRVIKFRTMTVCEDGPVVVQASRGDRRVTRVGRFLRRTSLDELPQLYNVLRGELSLVGPRPHALAHNEAYSQILGKYASRHKMKPGITGWAQVNGFRGETKTPEDMRQRVELDLDYIGRWSPWLDIEILARTALVPFSGSNAY